MKIEIPTNVNNDDKKIGFLAACKEKLIEAHNALPVPETGRRKLVLDEILQIDLEIDALKNDLPRNGNGDAYGQRREAHEKLHKGQANSIHATTAVADFLANHVSK